MIRALSLVCFGIGWYVHGPEFAGIAGTLGYIGAAIGSWLGRWGEA